jgi:hypothetical protein
MRTVKGLETFAKFFIGNDRDFALSIFSKLRGDRNVNEKTILHVKLMETKYKMPINIKTLSCSLEELGENSKIIVREIFKHTNLE